MVEKDKAEQEIFEKEHEALFLDVKKFGREVSSLDKGVILSRIDSLVEKVLATYKTASSLSNDLAADQVQDLEKEFKELLQNQTGIPKALRDYTAALITLRRAEKQFADNESEIQSRVVKAALKKMEEAANATGWNEVKMHASDIKTVIEAAPDGPLSMLSHHDNPKMRKLIEGDTEKKSLAELATDETFIKWGELTEVDKTGAPSATILETIRNNERLIKAAAVRVSNTSAAELERPLEPSQRVALNQALESLRLDLYVQRNRTEVYLGLRRVEHLIHRILHEDKAITLKRDPGDRMFLRPSTTNIPDEIYGEMQMFLGQIGQSEITEAEVSGLTMATTTEKSQALSPEQVEQLVKLRRKIGNYKSDFIRLRVEADNTLDKDDLEFIKVFTEEIKRYEKWLDLLIAESKPKPPVAQTSVEEAGNRPKGDASQEEWQTFYESNPNLAFYKAEHKKIMEAILRGTSRLQSHEKTDSQFLKQVKAFEAVLAQKAEELNEPELAYLADYMNKRRMVYDIDLVHSVTRALLSNADGAAAERGTVGFSFSEHTDWFLVPWMNEVQGENTVFRARRPDEMYKYQPQVHQAFEIMEELLLTKFGGGKFVEDDTGTAAVKQLVTEKLIAKNAALGNPKEVKEIIDEVVSISIQLWSIGQGRLDTYADAFSKGGSPVQKISEMLNYLLQCDPMSAAFYKAYKHTPFHEIEAVDIHDWYEKKHEEAMAKSDPEERAAALSKIDNIHHMAHGAELVLRTYAPLRKRRQLKRRKREINDDTMIEPVYPTALDMMWRRAKERLEKGITFENWSKVRPEFDKYWTTCWGEVPKRKDGQTHQEYRDALADAMQSLLTSKISGLKSNMMVDWDVIGDATVAFIDKLFRAYRTEDKSEIGMRLFWQFLNEKIKEDNNGNLDSAGPVRWHLPSIRGINKAFGADYLRDGVQHVTELPKGKYKKERKNYVKTGDLISMESYLLLQLSAYIYNNDARRKPNVRSNGHGGITGGGLWTSKAKLELWLFKIRGESQFEHHFKGLGRTDESQKDVSDDQAKKK